MCVSEDFLKYDNIEAYRASKYLENLSEKKVPRLRQYLLVWEGACKPYEVRAYGWLWGDRFKNFNLSKLCAYVGRPFFETEIGTTELTCLVMGWIFPEIDVQAILCGRVLEIPLFLEKRIREGCHV